MKRLWLFVDDDISFLESLRRLFSDYSAQVSSAKHPEILVCTNVTDALLVMQNQPVSLVVTDIVMPKLDGYQFLKLLQGHYPHVSKAVLSGHIDANTTTQCAKMGVDLVMTKPMNPVEAFTVFMSLKEADEECRRAGNPVPESKDPAEGRAVKDNVHSDGLAREPVEPVRSKVSPRKAPVDDGKSIAQKQNPENTLTVSPEDSEKVAEKTSGDKGLRGVLPCISIMELVQMLALSGRNSKLQVEWSGGEGEMYIFEGMVIHAACSGLLGTEAAYKMLCVNDGKFEIQAFQEPPLRSIQVSATGLLMEAARLMDMATQPQVIEKMDVVISRSESETPAQAATAPASKSKTGVDIKTEIKDHQKNTWRKITTNIKAHRQVTIIEEDINFSSEVTEEFPSAFSEENVIEVTSEPVNPLESAGVPREGLLELVVASSSGEVTLVHESANPELRSDLLEFFCIKKGQLDQQELLGPLVLIRLSGVTEECMIAFGKDSSIFARFNRPEYPTDRLLGLVHQKSCLTTKI
jgi:CheY-like chemotaxis protein